MKRLIGLTLALALLATGSAKAAASSYDAQGLAAGIALMSKASDNSTGFHGAQGFCKPFKKNRARCGEKVSTTLLDGTPVRCWAQIIVTVRRWHYPPERFGCPAEWYPG